MIKESEIDELSPSLNGLRIAWLLACWQAEHLIEGEASTYQIVDPNNLKEVVKMTKKEEIDAFTSKIIHSQTKTMILGKNMYVMTQSLRRGDGPYLPHSLSVMNMYNKVISGSKWVVVVVKNLMAILITIAKGTKVSHIVAAMWFPQ